MRRRSSRRAGRTSSRRAVSAAHRLSFVRLNAGPRARRATALDERKRHDSPWIALAALLLPACTSFAPDGGRSGVAERVGARVKYDATPVRERLAATRRGGRRRHRRAQPSVAAGGLRGAGRRRGRLRAGGAPAQPGILVREAAGAARSARSNAFHVRCRWAGHDALAARRGARHVRRRARIAPRCEVVRVADEARRAWIDAVAAAEIAAYAVRVQDAAAASAELARADGPRRQFQPALAGHASGCSTRRRPRGLRALATQRWPRASGSCARSGSPGAGHHAGAARAATRHSRRAARAAATRKPRRIANRLDMQAAKREVDALAGSVGLTRATGLRECASPGLDRNSFNELPRETGYEIAIEVPIFDWGDAKLARGRSHLSPRARAGGGDDAARSLRGARGVVDATAPATT